MVKELFAIRSQAHGGGGSLSVFFRWDPTAKYLATCGRNNRVHIYDRSGELIDEFPLAGQKPCIGLEWDASGDTLAVLQEGSSVIPLWQTNIRKVRNLNTDLKDPSFLVWSRVKPMLAVGTHKGNLVIHDQKTSKSLSLAGKHSKRITCGMWNLENKLALASQDKFMTISDEKGVTLEQAQLKYDPFDIQFAEQKVDEKQNMKENTVSINMGRQTILMYNMTDTENPVELAFQAKYGEIAAYKWFGDGYMMVGFSKGYVIAISTHMKEIGEELQSIKLHDAALTDLVYSAQLNKLASCAEDGVRVLDMQDWKELKSEGRQFTAEEGVPERLEWTRDGQILTVATSEGNVFNYLMSIPVLSNFSQQRLGYLSSLKNVSVIDVSAPEQPGISVEVDVEPNFMAVGPAHVAVGMNTHVFFYACSKQDVGKVNEREYEAGVRNMLLNERFAAVLCAGKVHLHPLVRSQNDEQETRIFPEAKAADAAGGGGGGGGAQMAVTSIGLTNDFLIYSTSRGSLHHFYLKDMAFVNEYIHDAAIVAVYPNPAGTRVLFIDSANKGFLYSPIDDKSLEIPKFPPSIDKVLWDPVDSGVFAAIDNKSKQIATYVYTAQTTRGPVVTKVALTKLAHGFEPVLLWDGNVHGQKSNNGQVVSTPLASHDAINYKPPAGMRRTTDKLKAALAQLLALGRLKQAWDLALVLKQTKEVPPNEIWRDLANRAMDQLDIDLAIRVCREMRDAGMVMALQQIQHVEDKHLLAGHICLLNRDYAKAQSLFLNSSAPLTALDMRKDLLEWAVAEKLAQSLAPQQIPFICKEYAQQLEVKGEYAQALMMYTRAHDELKDVKADAEHLRATNAGVARMTLRVGDLQRGKQLALRSGDKALMKECALILESMKQFSDAAEMYVQAEQYEKAATIYNSQKNFAKSAPLMDRITTPKIHAQYAKAKEMEKAYADAEKAYEKAKDMESVVRLNLQYLDNPPKAFAIVRKSRSAEGAGLVAEYCKANGQSQAAIEFLLIAKHNEEAFKLAEQKNEMPAYASFIGDDGTHDEYLSIAAYYEGVKDFARAGHYYTICGDYAKAVKLYLLCGESKLDDAIAVVKKAHGSAGSDLLTRAVLDYVTGETSVTKHNPAFVYKLYLAIGDIGPATHTALLIAADEMKSGDYSGARQVLFDIHQKLVEVKMAVPEEVRKNLVLLHSYALVKKFSAKAAPQAEAAARMLMRVAKSISKFPNHTVNILTSAIIWCTKAECKRTAFEYASQLMRNDTRDKIDKKYRKKIELIARRPSSEEKDERLSPCPFCDFKLPETLLDCPACKNSIPYCATTGKHMQADDWCFCPNCRFPHSYKAFLEHLHSGNKCDMCGVAVQMSAINKIDGKAYVTGGAARSFGAGSGGSAAGAADGGGGDDGKLSEEMQRKIKAREGQAPKKEDALNTEDM